MAITYLNTQINRLIIVGISGSGKSTLAKKISEILVIPVTHLDSLVFKENWQENDNAFVQEKLRKIINSEQWIIEGHIYPLIENVIEKADLIIYLDLSGFSAFIAGLKRWWSYKGNKRPEMADGCIEKFDMAFLKSMWQRIERPEIERAISGYSNIVVRLKTWKDVENFLGKLA